MYLVFISVFWYALSTYMCLLLDFISCRASWCSFPKLQGQNFDTYDNDLSICDSWYSRLLQNSPELKKLTVLRTTDDRSISVYMSLASFIFLVTIVEFLNNPRTMSFHLRLYTWHIFLGNENMSIVQNKEIDKYLGFHDLNSAQLWSSKERVFKDILSKLTHNNNVSVVLSSTKPNQMDSLDFLHEFYTFE